MASCSTVVSHNLRLAYNVWIKTSFESSIENDQINCTCNTKQIWYTLNHAYFAWELFQGKSPLRTGSGGYKLLPPRLVRVVILYWAVFGWQNNDTPSAYRQESTTCLHVCACVLECKYKTVFTPNKSYDCVVIAAFVDYILNRFHHFSQSSNILCETTKTRPVHSEKWPVWYEFSRGCHPHEYNMDN